MATTPETKHIPNHVITAKISEMPQEVQVYADQLDGRAIWVRRAQVLPVEAIVRGYITGELGGPVSRRSPSAADLPTSPRAPGSAWVEYQKSGTMHDIKLPEGLKESTQFIPPLFTPSTKAEIGDKDENIHPDKRERTRPDAS